jgi:hypothetical protein
MHKPLLPAGILLLGFISSTLAIAEESALKQDAKKVGQETGQIVHKIGEGGKTAGKEVAKIAVEIGHAARDGAKELAKAVKGDGGSNSAARTSASSSSAAHQHKSN